MIDNSGLGAPIRISLILLLFAVKAAGVSHSTEQVTADAVTERATADAVSHCGLLITKNPSLVAEQANPQACSRHHCAFRTSVLIINMATIAGGTGLGLKQYTKDVPPGWRPRSYPIREYRDYLTI